MDWLHRRVGHVYMRANQPTLAVKCHTLHRTWPAGWPLAYPRRRGWWSCDLCFRERPGATCSCFRVDRWALLGFLMVARAVDKLPSCLCVWFSWDGECCVLPWGPTNMITCSDCATRLFVQRPWLLVNILGVCLDSGRCITTKVDHFLTLLDLVLSSRRWATGIHPR